MRNMSLRHPQSSVLAMTFPPPLWPLSSIMQTTRQHLTSPPQEHMLMILCANLAVFFSTRMMNIAELFQKSDDLFDKRAHHKKLMHFFFKISSTGDHPAKKLIHFIQKISFTGDHINCSCVDIPTTDLASTMSFENLFSMCLARISPLLFVPVSLVCQRAHSTAHDKRNC